MSLSVRTGKSGGSLGRETCLDHRNQGFSLESREMKTPECMFHKRAKSKAKRQQNQVTGRVKEEPQGGES